MNDIEPKTGPTLSTMHKTSAIMLDSALSDAEKLDKVIDQLAADSDTQELVKTIESGIKTTAGNYGRYLSLLSGIKDKNARLIMSEAFIRAGADSSGVHAAMKIIG